MAKMVTTEKLAAELPQILQDVLSGPVEIRNGEETVAVLVSVPNYNSLVQSRGQRAIAALHRLQDMVQASGASEEELKELERALDRKAS